MKYISGLLLFLIILMIGLTGCNNETDLEKADYIAKEFIKRYETNFNNLDVDDVLPFLGDSKLSNIESLENKIRLDRKYIKEYVELNSLTSSQIPQVSFLHLNGLEKIEMLDKDEDNFMYVYIYKIKYNNEFEEYLSENDIRWNNVIKIYMIKVLEHYKVAYFEYVGQDYLTENMLDISNLDVNSTNLQEYNESFIFDFINKENLSKYDFTSNATLGEILLLQDDVLPMESVDLNLDNAINSKSNYKININNIPIIESWIKDYDLPAYRSVILDSSFTYSIATYGVGEYKFEIISLYSLEKSYIVSLKII